MTQPNKPAALDAVAWMYKTASGTTKVVVLGQNEACPGLTGTPLTDLNKAQERIDRLEERVAELEKDKARLDYLDECNRRLNEHYGTDYGWELIQNHNVNRLMLGHMAVDLHDSKGGGSKLRSCRDAIDVRMRERAALGDEQ